ncbi:ABC transporter permease [Mycobacterium paraffinicum]|uniref:ABC transporter permease n=1 Tax=Mycobacterium paraffinicum TaxID=53378 RepID=A0ABP8RDA5_9MYCO|nr:ABC transporter permease [Mycobacterium paraffinicum]MCV7313723.1 ABC transporter permease [Mycobacterium paraffinicum]
MTHRLGTQASLLTQSWVQAGRLLTEWRRERAVLVGSLIFPVCLLLVYEAVLEDRVQKVTGVESVYGLVPVCAVLSGLFGALSTSVSIGMERDCGLLSRMWVMPVHRASAITGRLTAEAARALIGTVLITVLGVVLGLRFDHGWPTAVPYILIPPIVVVGFTALVMAVAIRTNGAAVMTWLAAGTVALAFLNPGTTPIMLYPDWLRPFVRLQPMSPPIEAMWGLAHGGPIAWPLMMTLAWGAVLLAAFIPIAVRGYRLAAESHA